ncbi:MAG TPA: 50S ribosomal protein L19 [Candidatus Dojkabacteria bacterium]|jgi:large subunit ribosomal protein L19|nr:50S ribosomal protein L19 [Candidatus Dojkabacteria bacterium]
MDTDIIKKIEEENYKKRPDVRVGDYVKLHIKITEGKKERVQQFKGIVIAVKGSGLNKNIVVRKISYGIGVEKVVPLYSPVVDKIEIIKRGSVRKSKLFYLRKRVGRKAMKIDKVKDIFLTDEVVVPEEGNNNIEEAQVSVEETAA